jgi:hypothetical protein
MNVQRLELLSKRVSGTNPDRAECPSNDGGSNGTVLLLADRYNQVDYKMGTSTT